MDTFSSGIVVGFILFAVVASVFIFYKMQLELSRISRETDNIQKALQLALIKINRIEQMSHTTMNAAETFVDALRESAMQMNMSPNSPEQPGSFDDLRKSFEEGIKDMEDEQDGESDEPQEPWK